MTPPTGWCVVDRRARPRGCPPDARRGLGGGGRRLHRPVHRRGRRQRTPAGGAQRLAPAPEVLTSAGAVEARAPRVDDRRVDPDTGERARFSSAILPDLARQDPEDHRSSPWATERSGSGARYTRCSRPRGRRCWCHKIANVLGALPKSAHPGAKMALAEIWNAEDRRHALDAVSSFKGRLRGQTQQGRREDHRRPRGTPRWGFTDTPHFGRAFKEAYRMSPRDWRAQTGPRSLIRRCPVSNAAGWNRAGRRARRGARRGRSRLTRRG
jgi:hypothetical protein